MDKAAVFFVVLDALSPPKNLDSLESSAQGRLYLHGHSPRPLVYYLKPKKEINSQIDKETGCLLAL